jgi:hypothetical protein
MELFTQKETAGLLRISLAQLLKLRQAKFIRETIIGKKILFTRAEIERVIKVNTSSNSRRAD